MEILTKRLFIRNTIYKDYYGFYEIYKDKETSFYAGINPTFSLIDAQKLVFMLLEDPNVKVYSFFLKDTYTLIGTISFATLSNSSGVEVGYAIHKDFRRLGLTYESIKALLNYYNNHYFYSYYQAVIKKDNKPSIKLIEKLGFTFSGTFKNKDDNIYIKHKANL